MKKLTPIRVRAMLCLLLCRLRRAFTDLCRPSDGHPRREQHRLRLALNRFFNRNSPERVRYFSLVILQCWSQHEGSIRARIPDEEFAAFLDEVSALVASAYRYHAVHRQPLVPRRPGPLIAGRAAPKT